MLTTTPSAGVVCLRPSWVKHVGEAEHGRRGEREEPGLERHVRQLPRRHVPVLAAQASQAGIGLHCYSIVRPLSRGATPDAADRRCPDTRGLCTEAATYAQRSKPDRIGGFLEPFMAAMPTGGVVLDLGCGSGWASEIMETAGFDVHALDASPEFAALAQPKVRRPVRVMSFEGVEDVAAFDGIWASASLLHVPKAALPGLFVRLARALKPGGLLLATFKAGEGEARDKLGRFYSYYSLDELEALVRATPGLAWEGHLESTRHGLHRQRDGRCSGSRRGAARSERGWRRMRAAATLPA